jgi:hypothetical protein
MMQSLLAIACIAILPALAGCWLPARLDVPIAVGWAFGGVATTLIAVVLHAIGLGPTVTIAVATLAALGGAFRAHRVHDAIVRATTTERLLAGLVLVPIVAAALFALSTPVSAGDAVMAWYAKARALLDWPPLGQLPYAEYPDLGMMAWSLLLRVTGWAHEPAARLVFLAIYAAFALSLADMLGKPLSPYAAWIVPLAVFATFDLRLITNGYQDATLGAIGGLSAILLGNHLQTHDRGRAMIGLFFAGTLGLVKLEGAVLGAVLVVAWIIAQRFCPLRSRWSLIGLLVYAALAMLWPVLSWTHRLPLEQGQYSAFEGVNILDIPSRLARLPDIARAFLDTGPRFLVPFGALLVLWVAAWQRSAAIRPLLAFLGLAAAGHAFSIVTVFLLTNLDVSWHLATAFDRLVLQQVVSIWTPAMIASAVGLADLIALEFRGSRRWESRPAL